MAPILRLKGPQVATERVTTTSYTRIENGLTTRELIVKIQLPRLSSLQSRANGKSASESLATGGSTLDDLEEELPRTQEKAPVINDTDSDDLESELSWLDFELNQILDSSNSTVPSSEPGPRKPNAQDAGNIHTDMRPSMHQVKEETFEQVKQEQLLPMNNEKASSSEPPQEEGPKEVEYRNIPPNLLVLLRREFGATSDQDDLGIIEKMIFTLRDPLSATRIKLPVKSTSCEHFECFDFQNFCLFNSMLTGVQSALKKELMKKNLEQKKREKNQKLYPSVHQILEFMNPINIVQFKPRRPNNAYPPYSHVHSFKPTIPSYKCPICNVKFELHQLYISDVFNFFVKTTPQSIDRIELRDLNRYRIVEDQIVTPTASLRRKDKPESVQPEEIIILSDDDDVQRPATSKPDPTPRPSESTDEETEEQEYVPKTDHRYNFDDSDIDSIFRHLASAQRPQLYPHSAFPPHRPPEQDHYEGSGSWEDPVTLD